LRRLEFQLSTHREQLVAASETRESELHALVLHVIRIGDIVVERPAVRNPFRTFWELPLREAALPFRTKFLISGNDLIGVHTQFHTVDVEFRSICIGR